MAANARYHPAPQRDSLEEESTPFTRAPPSYEATAETPRTEDDNVPDDFKVRLYICFETLIFEK
jgi:protein lifeguard